MNSDEEVKPDIPRFNRVKLGLNLYQIKIKLHLYYQLAH
jgi:hypothetical protein